MKAWYWFETGKSPTLQQTKDPEAVHPDDLVADVLYSSLNHRDVWISKGKYPGIKFPCILGSDASGLYNGKNVIINPGLLWGNNEKVQSDDYQILGMPSNGTFAEKVLVKKCQVYESPAHLSPEEAAAIPLAGVTAYRALVVKCAPQNGQKVLITGIGGGVSQWAMLFAKAIGCEIYVTSTSQEKLNKAKKLGANGGVCTSDPDWVNQLLKMSGGVDIVIDSIMGPLLPGLTKVCLPGGFMCFYGASGGNTENFQPHVLFWRQISLIGSTMGSDLDFKNMLAFINIHKIRPVIDSVYSLNDLPDAFNRMQSAAQFGKIILNHSI
jgi:NADPH:quinone reductase-like Zn-dependent oxidoreductase